MGKALLPPVPGACFGAAVQPFGRWVERGMKRAQFGKNPPLLYVSSPYNQRSRTAKGLILEQMWSKSQEGQGRTLCAEKRKTIPRKQLKEKTIGAVEKPTGKKVTITKRYV